MKKKQTPDPKALIYFHELLIHPIHLIDNWMFYLIDPLYDQDHYLRSHIRYIIIYAMIDVCRSFQKKESLIIKSHNEASDYYYEYIKIFHFEILKFLRIFTKSELIFIQEFRHQLVHGSQFGSSRDSRTAITLKNGKFIEELLPSKKYWYFYRKAKAQNISDKYLNQKTAIWSFYYSMKDREIINKLYEDLRLNKSPRIIINPNNLKDWKKIHHEITKKSYNLREIRELHVINTYKQI